MLNDKIAEIFFYIILEKYLFSIFHVKFILYTFFFYFSVSHFVRESSDILIFSYTN